MAQYRRCKEKFRSAIYRLAVGEGDVRDRLRGAYKDLRILSERDVPPRLREELKSVLSDLTKRGPDRDPDGTVYRKSIDHTLSRIRNSTGHKIAVRIWVLAEQIG
jgi:hypothetical protein